MSKKTIVLGSRGSALALWQATYVKNLLEQRVPAYEYRIEVIKTTGDRLRDTSLSKLGDKGLFTRELEQALERGEVDVCVHSMKDMPSNIPEGLVIGGMPPRATPNDVLIAPMPYASVRDLPAGARVATGSARRQSQLARVRPDLIACEIRGNVDTRVRRVEEGDFDATILAAAGIKRMGLGDHIACQISIDEMVPAAGQGAIGLEIREDDEVARDLCQAVCDERTFREVETERVVLSALEGGCQAPLGIYAHHEQSSEGGEQLMIEAFVGSLDGARCLEAHVEGPCDQARDLAWSIAHDLISRGAGALLDEARQ